MTRPARMLARIVAAGLLFGTAAGMTVPAYAKLAASVATPPTQDAFSMKISPDGRQVVLAGIKDGKGQLFLGDTATGQTRPLDGTAGGRFPFWSPDGKSVGFFADGKLKRLDLARGKVLTIVDAPSGRGGAWTRDGRIIFAGSNVIGLSVVPAKGGQARTLTTLGPAQGSHRWPALLPDGDHFLFAVASPKEEVRGMYVGALSGGAPVRIMGGDVDALYAAGNLLRVTPKGDLVREPFDLAARKVTGPATVIAHGVATDTVVQTSAVSVSNAGVLVYRKGAASAIRQLTWLDADGGVAGVTGGRDAQSPGSPEISPDGRMIALNRTIASDADIWFARVADGALTRVTTLPSFDLQPVWAADGRSVIFRSNRNGHYDLFRRAVDGTEDVVILKSDADKAPHAVSPDGKTLLFGVQNPKANSELWMLPLDGSGPARPWLQSGFDTGQGQFAPDGRSIAYTSNESGIYEIYVRGVAPGSAAVRVSTGGGVFPRWKPDGGALYFITPDLTLFQAARKADGGFAPPVRRFAIKLPAGRNMGFGGYNAKAQYAVAPDGRILLAASTEDPNDQPPISIVENWQAAAAQ